MNHANPYKQSALVKAVLLLGYSAFASLMLSEHYSQQEGFAGQVIIVAHITTLVNLLIVIASTLSNLINLKECVKLSISRIVTTATICTIILIWGALLLKSNENSKAGYPLTHISGVLHFILVCYALGAIFIPCGLSLFYICRSKCCQRGERRAPNEMDGLQL